MINLSDYKLIVTDLDGTLVKYGSDEISGAVKDIINSIVNQGISFTIATGRSWNQAKKIVRELTVKMPVILQSGAIIMEPASEKILHLKPLRRDFDEKLRKITGFPLVDQFILDESGNYYTGQINTNGGRTFFKKYGDSCIITKPVKPGVSIIKHLFIGPEEILQQLAEKIISDFKPRPNWILWPPEPGLDDFFLEIFDPGASKGQALQWLSEYLKIQPGQVMAFGDGDNDLDLLTWAGLGVAMEDAPVQVSAKAKLVIPGPEFDGLARFLRGEFGSFKREIYN